MNSQPSKKDIVLSVLIPALIAIFVAALLTLIVLSRSEVTRLMIITATP